MTKSTLLPKLLAKENVTIKHGNYKTAWFDIKNRVLGLPLWEDMHKDVYDLFVGHEVGHALETPFEGWHDSPEKLKGCPRSYINVIEDARIERKIQSRYPGLVGSFNRGYSKLLEREFFGPLDDINWEEVKLIDKINLKTKLGTKLEVPFNDEEKVFLDRSLNTTSFDEVLDLVRDILSWTKENQEELIQQPEPAPTPSLEDTDNQEQQEQEQGQGGHDDYEQEDNENGQPSTNDEITEDEKSESEKEITAAPVEPEHTEDDISITDTIFREKEKTLIENGKDGQQPVFLDDVNNDIISKAVIDFATLKKAREDHEIKRKELDGEWYEEFSYDGFPQHLKNVKKNVQVAVKEFEMRKAAYRYTRAQTAKTGTIDVNKLWSYKTNEDIFFTATKLADSKNHGMMLLIDMSGSMASSMHHVMDQVMHLVMFCKAVNIPFEVYGFTSTNPNLEWDQLKGMDIPFEIDGLSMPLISSSSLNKADFTESMKHMYKRASTARASWGDLCKFEEWGSTPLNQALIVSHHLVKKFKRKHGVEKMNFITFTDGDANRIAQYYGRNENVETIYPDRHNAVIMVDGSRVKTRTGSRQVTKNLLENMKKKYGTNNIGFFMADDAGAWRQRLWIVSEELGIYSEEYKSNANKEYRKNKCVNAQNVLGYSEYYLVKGGNNLSTEEDEFEVSHDASNANIRNAFKKFAKSKKQNKILMTKFGKAVA